VAAAAGVSASTVSRVIRKHPDVGQETRARVLGVVDGLSYRPSGLARALASGRSPTIGLLVSDIANPFYPPLAKAIEQRCRKLAYSVVICNTNDDPDTSVEYIERLLAQGVEGFIHASAGPDENAVLAALGDPRRIVFANRRPRSTDVSYVVSNNVGGGRQLGEYLIAQGHSLIAFLSGPPWASSSAERLTGLAGAVEQGGGEMLVAQGDFTPKMAVQAVTTWLERAQPPTAFVGINDQVAAAIYVALTESGLAVPDQAAVAGFDNVEFAWSAAVPLTTVGQRTETMGRRALDILLRQVRNPTQRLTFQDLPMDLFVRNTTDLRRPTRKESPTPSEMAQ
jgi:LacI family transcriptional regulator